MSMNDTTLADLIHQEMSKRESIEVHIRYLITNEGEIIPFNRLRRLSTAQFKDEQGMYDTLSDDGTIPTTPLWAELDNGSRCVLDLDDADFQNSVNMNTHGAYISSHSFKQIVIDQFAREYKYETIENNDREKITGKGTGKYTERERG